MLFSCNLRYIVINIYYLYRAEFIFYFMCCANIFKFINETPFLCLIIL